MKKIIITCLVPLLATAGIAQTKKPIAKKPATATKTTATANKPTPVALKSALDSASYSFGMGMASSMKAEGLTGLNYELLVKGLKDAFAGTTPLIPEEKSRQAIANLFKSVNQKKYAGAIAEGNAFLAKNKTQAGVQTTASGLQYQVITRGTGIKPTATDTVLVHYKGTFLDGKEFDSSYSRNEPLSLPLSGVIKGWTEGVQLMQAGAKYKFFIPYHLAYGESGGGPGMPPYSTLIFEIELLKVTPPAKAAEAAQ